jgi:hypothetical protein
MFSFIVPPFALAADPPAAEAANAAIATSPAPAARAAADDHEVLVIG